MFNSFNTVESIDDIKNSVDNGNYIIDVAKSPISLLGLLILQKML